MQWNKWQARGKHKIACKKKREKSTQVTKWQVEWTNISIDIFTFLGGTFILYLSKKSKGFKILP
jgi:outer membrane biogenesis lipoprotein LolB